MWRARRGMIVAVLVLVGCPADDSPSDGSGGAAGGGPGGGAGGVDLCAAHLAWDMACAMAEPEPREEPFWGATECPMGPWDAVRTPFLEAAARCFETLPCEGSDDACTDAGFAALGYTQESDVADDTDLVRCHALARDCEELHDDSCGFLLIFGEAARNRVVACLDEGCVATAACLQDPGAP